MRINALTLASLFCASTLATAQNQMKSEHASLFTLNVYHAGTQLPATGPVPLVLEIENRSPNAHKLFISPIFFGTRPSNVKGQSEKRATLPPGSDIYIELLVERTDPAELSPAEMSQGGLQDFKPVDLAPGGMKLVKVIVPRSMFGGKQFRIVTRLLGTDVASAPVFLRQP
jgi:hypothetical protein